MKVLNSPIQKLCSREESLENINFLITSINIKGFE